MNIITNTVTRPLESHNFNKYLNDTPGRIRHLRKLIDGRPLAILLPGPSIKELEERKAEFAKYDICYATVNDFWIMEEKIHQCDIVMCSADECNVPDKVHLDFMRRKDDNIFISELAGYHHRNLSLVDYLREFNDRLLYFVADRTPMALKHPDIDFPLHFLAQASFSLLVCLGIIGQAKSIILFGADGGKIGDAPLYYGGWKSQSQARLEYDTMILNQTMLQILENVYKTYELPRAPIFNCSPQSKYTVFPKITYEGMLNELQQT